MLASTYPLLDFLWTMIEIFFFIIWIWLAIMVFVDIFRSHDMGGWAKALWVLFVVILPFLGILVYLIARGGGMQERAAAQAAREQKAFDQYVRQTAGSSRERGRVGQAGRPQGQGLASPMPSSTLKRQSCWPDAIRGVGPPVAPAVRGRARRGPEVRGRVHVPVSPTSRRSARVSRPISSKGSSSGGHHPTAEVSSPSGRGTPPITLASKTVTTYDTWSPFG